MTRDDKRRGRSRHFKTGQRSLGGLSITELDRVARALGYLLDVEREHVDESDAKRWRIVDPEGVAFEAFAVGAIERMCELTMRAPTGQSIAAVRYVAALLTNDDRHALERGLEVTHLLARPDLQLFRDAGRRSVDACLDCDAGLAHFAAALRKHSGGPLQRSCRD